MAMGGIEREKELKGWRRSKKDELIHKFNPNWTFLNDQITQWPPEPGTY